MHTTYWLLTVEQPCVRLKRRLSYNFKMHLTEADCEDISRIVWDGQKTQQWASVVINRNLRFNNEGINTKEIFTDLTAYATWNLRVPYNVFYSENVKMFVLFSCPKMPHLSVSYKHHYTKIKMASFSMLHLILCCLILQNYTLNSTS